MEYFFALSIGNEKLTAALWTIEDKQLKILETSSENFTSLTDLASGTDKLLDAVLGLRDIEPQKILFGVPGSWLTDEDLKGEYLKVLRDLVKELELSPMAYVESSHALVHFLEKQEGIPPTAILVGFEHKHLTVSVVRAGKLDGVKIIQRGESNGADIEKALLTFTGVETLPSKLLLYGEVSEELKSQLLSFSWMANLSFLHFPKIEGLNEDIEIKSICLAGASELESSISYRDQIISKPVKKTVTLDEEELPLIEEDKTGKEKKPKDDKKEELTEEKEVKKEDLGFVVGDVSAKKVEAEDEGQNLGESEILEAASDKLVIPEETRAVEIDDFEHELEAPVTSAPVAAGKPKFQFKLIGLIAVVAAVVLSYLFLPKAEVKIFVEPKILEKDTQVTADPNQKLVDEAAKLIPGQLVDTEISGSSKGTATGKKQIGDPAKGTVIIRNKTDGAISLSKGSLLSTSNGLKFALDTSVTVASRSADDGTWGKATGTVAAQGIGAEGNLPSGSDLTAANYSTDKLVTKAEGNFSGGTSKDVTVVSTDDQQKLLAVLTSDLRKQAQQKLQEKLPQKKILEEALSEEVVKKSFTKNVNDQASEFSLNLTVRYKGTAFEDKDLKMIVSKLVITQVPSGFDLNLDDTETQADVSNVEKGGKLIFLARFKAKLLPKIDADKVKNQIKGKSVSQAADSLKSIENVLGSEIKITPSLPGILNRIPILTKNIKVEVGLK